MEPFQWRRRFQDNVNEFHNQILLCTKGYTKNILPFYRFLFQQWLITKLRILFLITLKQHYNNGQTI